LQTWHTVEVEAIAFTPFELNLLAVVIRGQIAQLVEELVVEVFVVRINHVNALDLTCDVDCVSGRCVAPREHYGVVAYLSLNDFDIGIAD
jgi:hypothetical protein